MGDWVEWPSKLDSLNGRAEPASVRPFVRRLAVQMKRAWWVKTKRFANTFIPIISGRRASQGVARPGFA
jgi:hypothetical protein